MSNNSLLEYKLDLIADALGAYKIETVTSVIRRAFTKSDGEDAEVIDFYPAWNATGSYGKHKVASEYIDHDWQRQRFEKFSGVVIDSLPVYESNSAAQRVHGRVHKCEVNVRPFQLILKPQPVADGADGKTLILRYLAARPGQEAAPAPTAPPAPNGNGNGQPLPAQGQRPNGSRQSQATAPAPVEFDDLVSATEQKFASSLLAKQPWYKTENAIIEFRKVLFGEWNAKQETAYWVGLLRYAELREGQQTHQVAKIEALNRYHRELKEGVTA